VDVEHEDEDEVVDLVNDCMEGEGVQEASRRYVTATGYTSIQEPGVKRSHTVAVQPSTFAS